MYQRPLISGLLDFIKNIKRDVQYGTEEEKEEKKSIYQEDA